MRVLSQRKFWLLAVVSFAIAACSSDDAPTGQSSPPLTPANWGLSAGTSGGFNVGNSIATDGSGNVYFTGSYNDTIQVGNVELLPNGGASGNVVIAKVDPTGAVKWARSGGGPLANLVWNIDADATGGTVISGRYAGTVDFGGMGLTSSGGLDMFLIRYDSGGNVLWASSAGGTGSDQAGDAVFDTFGNIVVSGSFSSTATFGSLDLTSAGGLDIMIGKYDAGGNALWVRRGGGSATDLSFAIAADGMGNVIMAGYFSNTADFGTTNLTTAGDFDVVLAKYDAAGTLLWARRAGGPGNDQGNAVLVDDTGKIYVAGSFEDGAVFGTTTLAGVGERDVYLAKYDVDGSLLWVQSGGGTDFDGVADIVMYPSGNIAVVGDFRGSITFDTTTLTSAGNVDVFMAEYGASGNLIGASSGGGSNFDEPNGAAIGASQSLVMTGRFRGTSTFGSTTLTSTPAGAGGHDIFVVQEVP